MSYIFDVVIILVLAFFAWRGASRGLIMSLFGLMAAFVAFFAGRIISDAFCDPVANIIRPMITQSVQDAAQRVENLHLGEEDYTVDDLLDYLRKNERFQGFTDYIARVAPSGPQRSPVNALSGYLSKGIARVALFGIVFVGVQLVWFLVSQTLDLAFKLPILAQVNLAGGLVFGLIQGVLLVIVLVWLGRMSGVVPTEPDTPILTLFTVERLSELLESLPA